MSVLETISVAKVLEDAITLGMPNIESYSVDILSLAPQ